LVLLIPVFATAQFQRSQLDSMHREVQHAGNDTILMDAYIKLGSFYDDVNLDSSVYYGYKGITIAQKLGLRMHEAEILMNSSFPLAKMGNYPLALNGLNRALQILEDPSSEKITWGRGSTVGSSGKTPELYRLVLLAYTYMGLDNLYYYTGDFEKLIAEANKAKTYATSLKDTLLLAQIYNDLGIGYSGLGQLDSAIFFQQQALAFYATLPFADRKYEGIPYSIIGDCYRKMGKIALAKENFEKALQINLMQNNTARTGDAYLQLGDIFKSLNKPDSSVLCYKQAVEFFKIAGKEKWQAVTYRKISDYYAAINNRDSSFAYLQLSTTLNDKLDHLEKEKLQEFQVAGFQEALRSQELEKERIQTQNKIRTYAMLAVLAVLSIIGFILYRNNRQKQKANAVLEATLSNLKSTQSQLIQSEKMASLGELTAGIAHEIQNPLNFVNNFSEVNNELVEEIKNETNIDEIKAIADDIKQNSEKILFHGKRADAIVKGMLQHSQASTGKKESTDINALADEYLRLSYHGLRAKDKDFNATTKTDFDESIGNINIIPQDIGRVLLNLYNNAFYAVNEKKKQQGENYEPTVSIKTKKLDAKIEVSVKDNGNGIPQKVIDKIFQPFFTTKPTGQGTGLGLSLSYDIIKAHCGEIKVESKEGEGAEFLIELTLK
jgi:signal transduction histidine kinase